MARAGVLRKKRVLQIGIMAVMLLAGIVGTSLFRGRDTDIGSMRHLLEEESEELKNYPTDAFTKDERKNGAIIFHVMGSMYMFAALAIICDEFFVPSLEVISEKLDLEDDVAGATFMAAGGSAPELATSFIGTFINESNVGFGTIVGSAVFNILFVIGACAMVSPGAVQLTWWPLFRDSAFYSLGLAVLIACFIDRNITWYEALILFLVYIVYVTFMKYNRAAEAGVRRCFVGDGEDAEDEKKDVEMAALDQKGEGGASETKLGDKDEDKEEPRMHFGIHKFLSSQRDSLGGPPKRVNARRGWKILKIKIMDKIRKRKQKMADVVLMAMADPKTASTENFRDDENLVDKEDKSTDAGEGKGSGSDGDDEESEPMDLEWPSTTGKRISYVILAPLTFLLYYTIPDVRRKEREGFYAVSFGLSIFYIGFFSYFMVWWITLIGDTTGIPSEIMGLTVLAIGTSVPDLLESIIVAKQGRADMAVSSSIGSNIFDITIGLPIPWFLYTVIKGRSIEVGTDGLFVSVVLLFAMLISCISTIALSGWKMSKTLGFIFFVLWLVFVGISIGVEVM